MKEFFAFCLYPIKKALWIPALVFIAYVIGISVFNAYEVVPWWDIPMHFLGGAAICNLFWTASKGPYSEMFMGKHTRFSLFVMLVSLTALVAICWEGLEWSRDMLDVGHYLANAGDTLCDLFMGLCGGSAIALIAAFQHTTEKG